MSPRIQDSSENLLKSRYVKLAPKTSIAIGFARQNSSSLATPSSSASVTSDNVTCEHCDPNGATSQSLSTRTVAKCPAARHGENGANGLNEPVQPQSSPVDRQSFSSISTTDNTRDCLCQQPFNCAELFNEFVRENMLSTCFMSPANSLSKLDLVGFIYPSTLLVTGQRDSLNLLCSLWNRRILKSPSGYCIRFVGHTSLLEVTTISQAQFTPLAEALHRCVDELNSRHHEATFEAVVRQLNVEFPSMELPSDEILKSSLSSLVAESKLSFDQQRQTYTATRTLLTPWDEFENLTLSDNFKSERDDDEIELEFKNIHHSESINKCANFEQMIYLNSNTLSTEISSIDDHCKEEHYLENAKLLRRNSSLSNEFEPTGINSEPRRANFKRSKSLKMNYKPGSGGSGQLLAKECTCNDMIIKRQSLFSKLLKFGHSNSSSNLKSRSVSTSSVKYAHFGSQFPEESDNCAVIPYNENYAKKQAESHSKATQTVKCGPEDMVTLIMKQAGRHALARSRPSQRQMERVENKCACANGSPVLLARHRESRNGSRKSRYKHYATGNDNERELKCQCALNGEQTDLLSSHHHQHQYHLPLRHRESNRHRKLRSSSLRNHYRPREWLVDYEGNNMLTTKVTEKQQLRRGASRYSCLHSEEDEEPSDEHISHFYVDNRSNSFAVETNDANYPNKINGHWSNSGGHNGNSNSNFLISNSLNLKIEIETSSMLPPPPPPPLSVPPNQAVSNGGLSTCNSMQTNGIHLSSDRTKLHLASAKQIAATGLLEGNPSGKQFANDIYSELTFDRRTHKLSRVTSRTNFPGATARVHSSGTVNGFTAGYSPDLNYTNSITALKEQIARAKANFFNAPLSSSTTR